ncbi:GH25 family lysozyme [Sphingomonas sp. Leaf357]|uniref:GH25 family lysozyme n=1 Tax=Sphingomonas sp. Leaf357 TaxID=1736350 RepID=UPI001F40B51C|nr:GH25 family lysozyme [Sphingomonas sp. Leaf357]
MSLRLFGRRLGWAGVALFGLLAIALLGWVFVTGWHPSRKDYEFQGVDVDESKGAIHWPTVAASGADFAYMRATMGADGRDAQFATSWADAHAAGMRRGALHVWSFCRLAADQANNFNTTVPRVEDALPAAVLIDFSPDCTSHPERDVVIAEVTRFVTMVESHTGKPILLKIAAPVEAAYSLSAGVDRPLWSLRNFFPPDYAARPWRMWQASDVKRIDGIDGPVHWNVVAP